jgi:hypothetical protein
VAPRSGPDMLRILIADDHDVVRSDALKAGALQVLDAGADVTLVSWRRCCRGCSNPASRYFCE